MENIEEIFKISEELFQKGQQEEMVLVESGRCKHPFIFYAVAYGEDICGVFFGDIVAKN